MKKNILKLTLVAVFALLAGYQVYMTKDSNKVSDLLLANVDALARGEWDGDGSCHMDKIDWICLKYADGDYCYCGL